jgi:hypothetical protein
MSDRKEFTDAEGRTFCYERGARVYLDGGKDTGAEIPSSEPPATLAANLKDYLASKGWARLGERTKWLQVCMLDVRTGALWAGDPHLANKEDGCVVRVPPGIYRVEGIGAKSGPGRAVARLRVCLESVKKTRLGKKVGHTGTDSAMIGVCDIDAFDAACETGAEDEVQAAIEAQTENGFGVITLPQYPGAIMPFVPTGSDGSSPVRALMADRRCVGIEINFEAESEDQDG